MCILKKKTEFKPNILVPILVLLWKYAIMRAHRYCHSFWEIFGGLSFFLLLFLIHQISINDNLQRIDAKNHLRSNGFGTRVIYRPYNNFTRRLMTRVEQYLTAKEPDYMPKQWDFESSSFPIDENLLKNSHYKLAVVDFKNNGSYTPDLEYTIRVISHDIKNNLNRRPNGIFHAITPKEKTAPPYLGTLQWAIDKSYLEQLSNLDIEQFVQMISYPKYISEELRTLHSFMILCTILAPLPFFLIYSAIMGEERRSGLRELMKLSGICPDVLRCSHIIETTFVGILYGIPATVILKVTSTPILPFSNFFIIAFSIILHYVNTMALAFITTALSQDFHHADCVGLLLYMSTFILDFLWYSFKENTCMIYIVCSIMPHAPIYLFWDEVLYLETTGQGSQFWNFNKKHSNNCMSVSTVWLFFNIQLAVITTLAWYLDLVRPGHYGVSKKWDFMFRKKYWSKKRRKVLIDPTYYDKRDHRYFEKRPKNAEIAIQAYRVTKIFHEGRGKTEVVALNSISFDCYKGEITMVLGANGAGKTTLMLIVAGMFSATKGAVYVNGMEVAHKVMELREDVGLCMQKNICFRYLTVRENITFFKKLKTKPADRGFSVDQLMQKLRLSDVANYFSKQLSPGTLRCLQVACVLAGDADVLVLDEPTTGMDIDVRHCLWDLIMVLRGKKTVLMTTSCLEEANALGDRIVILNEGVIKCHGTPSFLKHAIGTSFNLSITIQEETKMKNLMEMVDSLIPELKYKKHDKRRITFSLPTSLEFQNFPKLFKALEEKRKEFGIILMDVGMFMEEVFAKFIQSPGVVEYYNKAISLQNFRKNRTVGYKLILTQISLLNRRVFDYLLRTKYQFLILRVAIPFICLVIITLMTNHALRNSKLFSHQISLSHKKGVTKLVYNVGPFSRKALISGVDKYPGVEPVYALDIERGFTDPSADYLNENTVGFKIKNNYTKIFHSLDPYVTSKAVNMFSNLYTSIFMPYLNNTIRTTFEPLVNPMTAAIKVPKSTFLCLKWTSWVTFLVILPLTPIIILCIAELKSGARGNHMMAGCTPVIYWGTKMLTHLMIFIVVVVVPVIVIGVLLDLDRTFAQAFYIGAVFLLLIIFAPAFLANLYFFSFVLHENLAISHIYITSLFFGVILPILLCVLEPVWNSSLYITILYFILECVGRVSPMFPFGVGLGKLTQQARLNAYCSLNRRLCPNLVADTESDFDVNACCASSSLEPFPYLVSYNTGLMDLLNLVFHIFFFSTLVILLEYRIPQYLYERLSLVSYKKPSQAFLDQSVKKEKNYVRTALRKGNYRDDVILVDNVHKHYAHTMRKHKFNAVNGITFAVKQGECLAILGSETTGKSTLLRLLSGNIVMTRGHAYIQGVHIRTNRMGYLHKINLTSSAGGMDSFRTGLENLMFIAKLKGYSDQIAYRLSSLSLRLMGLQGDDIFVSKYSSGCLRRLALCSTLVLAPKVAFLDEPMRDIDETSKPLVAQTMQRLMLETCTVIVAETSVDWRILEPVFTRIAIMSKGQFAAIGPAADVLASVARGYSARIKLKMVTAFTRDIYRMYIQDDGSSDSETHSEKSLAYVGKLYQLKAEFLKVFKTSKFIEEHLSMLYFYIKDDDKTQLYSDMFTKLQQLKEKFEDLVDDYYLSATTVEDVFWRLEHAREPLNLNISSPNFNFGAPGPTSSTTKSNAPTPSTTNSDAPTPLQTGTNSDIPTPSPNVTNSDAPTPSSNTSNTDTPIPSPKTTNSDAPTPSPNTTNSDAPTPSPNTTNSDAPTPSPNTTNSDAPTPPPNATDSNAPAPSPNATNSDAPTPPPNATNSDAPTSSPNTTNSDAPTPSPNTTNSDAPTPPPNATDSNAPTSSQNATNSDASTPNPKNSKSQK